MRHAVMLSIFERAFLVREVIRETEKQIVLNNKGVEDRRMKKNAGIVAIFDSREAAEKAVAAAANAWDGTIAVRQAALDLAQSALTEAKYMRLAMIRGAAK